MNSAPRASTKKTLGPYVLLRSLGEGGMGVVYHGRHRETGLEVAIKSLRVPRRNLLEGLRREVHALSRLQHPGIVRILDEGLEEGIPWYAMELLEGRTLDLCRTGLMAGFFLSTSTDLGEDGDETGFWTASLAENLADTMLAEKPETPVLSHPAPATPDFSSDTILAPQGPGSETLGAARFSALEDPMSLRAPLGTGTGTGDPLSVPALGRSLEHSATELSLRPVLRLVRKLCDALAYLHGEGIVHRDLKPANILVRSNGSPIIVDFGIAHSSGGSPRARLEVGGLTSGTLHYMSPEQLRAETVDARADLYALGCILFQLVTGTVPFRGATFTEIAHGHLRESPPPPRSFSPALPPRLNRLILDLLAKVPRKRPGHAGVVAAALDEILGESPRSPRPVGKTYLYQSPMVGREKLVEAVSRNLFDTGRESGPKVLSLLFGPTGVGKTRILTGLARRGLGSGYWVIAGSAHDEVESGVAVGRGGGTLHSFRGLLQSLADHCRQAGSEVTRKLLSSRGRLLARYEPSLQDLPGVNFSAAEPELSLRAAKVRLFSYLLESLAALARVKPILLLLDDLQETDQLSLEFLRFLCRSARLSSLPISLCGAFRKEEAPPALQELLGFEAVLSHAVEPLGAASIAQMVQETLALDRPPRVFCEFLMRHCEGNPFFVAEYLRTAVAQGILFRDAYGRWQVEREKEGPATVAAYEALPLPLSIRELMEGRLRSLSPRARSLAEAASVLGPDFQVSLLSHLKGAAPEDLWDSLGELTLKQIVEASGSGGFRFLHAKLAETCYAGLSESERRSLHERAASRLGEHPAEEDWAEVARHWYMAGVSERAIPAYLAAARFATVRYEIREAERFYTAALDLMKGLSERRILALMALGEKVLLPDGRLREAAQLFQTALSEARDLGKDALECGYPPKPGRATKPKKRRAAYKNVGPGSALPGGCRAKPCQGTGDGIPGPPSGNARRDPPSDSEALPGRLRFHSPGNVPPCVDTLECKLQYHLAYVHQEQGHMPQARRGLDRAMEIARRIGDRELQLLVLRRAGQLNYERGYLGRAAKLFHKALAKARDLAAEQTEGGLYNDLAILSRDRGEPGEAEQWFSASLNMARKLGDRRQEGSALGNLGVVYHDAGRFHRAEEDFARARAIFRETGDRPGEAWATQALAGVAFDRGDYKKAFTLAQKAMAITKEVGNRKEEAVLMGNLASLQIHAGKIQAARDLFKEATRLCQAADSPRWEGVFLADWARLERQAGGNLETAARFLDRAESLIRGLDRDSETRITCERGFMQLAQGKSARETLARCAQVTEALGDGASADLVQDLQRLGEAQAAFEAGEEVLLHQGSLVKHLPAGLQRWLQERGILMQGSAPWNPGWANNGNIR